MRRRCYSNTRRHCVVPSVLFCLILLSQTATSAYSTLSLADEQAVPLSTERQAQVPRQIHSADAQKLGVGQDIQFVEQLVIQSAAAKTIQHSDNAKAKALQQEAIQDLKRARQAQQAGDTQTVREALHEAKSKLFQAIRMTGEKEVKDKQQRDFKARVKSTTALLEAHKRIRVQKQLGKPAREVEQHVASQIQSAQNEFNKGRLGKAMTQINAAYLSIKLSVTRLRDGDTLVRELHFETKEDEYKYELERNRTHRILVEVVLKEKLSPRMSLLMKTPMAKAEELRALAVQQAESGDYDKAIHTLEQSTQQIIRAIRMAGVYIPG